MGGLKFNEKTQVINKEGKPIEGLFAAGENDGRSARQEPSRRQLRLRNDHVRPHRGRRSRQARTRQVRLRRSCATIPGRRRRPASGKAASSHGRSGFLTLEADARGRPQKRKNRPSGKTGEAVRTAPRKGNPISGRSSPCQSRTARLVARAVLQLISTDGSLAPHLNSSM